MIRIVSFTCFISFSLYFSRVRLSIIDTYWHDYGAAYGVPAEINCYRKHFSPAFRIGFTHPIIFNSLRSVRRNILILDINVS